MKHRYNAFTLVEMLVTISIVILVLAITIPIMLTMTRAFNSAGGKTSVQAAITAARGYATQVPSARYASGTAPGSVPIGSDYSGAAAIFTPSGEIRIVENAQDARNHDGDYVDMAPVRLNAFRDVKNRDYVTMPRDSIALGVTRRPGGVIVLTAPFAVRFDKNGQVASGDNYASQSMVYYDANYDRVYDTRAAASDFQNGTARRNPYNMNSTPTVNFAFDQTPYDPDYWNFNHAKFHDDVYVDGLTIDASGNEPGNYALPFEAIETASIILLVSRRALEGEGLDLSSEPGDANGDLNQSAKDWVMSYDSINDTFNNAEQLFVGSYSGALTR